MIHIFCFVLTQYFLPFFGIFLKVEQSVSEDILLSQFIVMCHVCLHPSFHNVTEDSPTKFSMFLFPLFKVTRKLCLSVILSQLCIYLLAFLYFIFFFLVSVFCVADIFVSPVPCVFINHYIHFFFSFFFFFTVTPCILIISSLLCIQLMHNNIALKKC